MLAVWIESGQLGCRELPRPPVAGRWTRVRVLQAGVCGTDLALARGLYGFRGVPGHEFVGVVDAGPGLPRGTRVVAGINVGCGRCAECRDRGAAHCRRRRVLGIRDLHGAFATYLRVPAGNLLPVAGGLDDDGAVFCEPLAAALAAVADAPAPLPDRALVVGPGRLGQLVVRVLRAHGVRVCCVGRGAAALERLPRDVEAVAGLPPAWRRRFELAFECSGSASGLGIAMDALRARGSVVLKSTHGSSTPVDADRLVVDEIRLIGSRCGPMAEALDWLAQGRIDPRPLITARHCLSDVRAALRDAASPAHVKVLMRPDDGLEGDPLGSSPRTCSDDAANRSRMRCSPRTRQASH